jgi:hypothetical protein
VLQDVPQWAALILALVLLGLAGLSWAKQATLLKGQTLPTYRPTQIVPREEAPLVFWVNLLAAGIGGSLFLGFALSSAFMHSFLRMLN